MMSEDRRAATITPNIILFSYKMDDTLRQNMQPGIIIGSPARALTKKLTRAKDEQETWTPRIQCVWVWD